MSERQRFTYGVVRIHPRPKIGLRGSHDIRTGRPVSVGEPCKSVTWISGRIMEKCGFRDTGDVNWLSHLYKGDERPVKIMRLDYVL